MPKATVNEYDSLPIRKDKVWGPREISTMQAKTESKRVCDFAHSFFGSRIATLNR